MTESPDENPDKLPAKPRKQRSRKPSALSGNLPKTAMQFVTLPKAATAMTGLPTTALLGAQPWWEQLSAGLLPAQGILDMYKVNFPPVALFSAQEQLSAFRSIGAQIEDLLKPLDITSAVLQRPISMTLTNSAVTAKVSDHSAFSALVGSSRFITGGLLETPIFQMSSSFAALSKAVTSHADVAGPLRDFSSSFSFLLGANETEQRGAAHAFALALASQVDSVVADERAVTIDLAPLREDSIDAREIAGALAGSPEESLSFLRRLLNYLLLDLKPPAANAPADERSAHHTKVAVVIALLPLLAASTVFLMNLAEERAETRIELDVTLNIGGHGTNAEREETSASPAAPAPPPRETHSDLAE